MKEVKRVEDAVKRRLPVGAIRTSKEIRDVCLRMVSGFPGVLGVGCGGRGQRMFEWLPRGSRRGLWRAGPAYV